MTKLEMNLEVSAQEGFEAPHIKKGYYAAKLLDVKKFEKDDKEVIDKWGGKKLIFDFAIYYKDEADNPTKQVEINKGNVTTAVNLSAFATYQYVKNGEIRTAVTPNSQISKIMRSLGWKLDPEKTINPSDLVGNWCEVLLDDWSKEGSDVIRSVIKDFSDLATAKNGKIDLPKTSKKVSPEIKKLEDKLVELDKMLQEELITKEGFDQSVEAINTKIEELKKQ